MYNDFVQMVGSYITANIVIGILAFLILGGAYAFIRYRGKKQSGGIGDSGAELMSIIVEAIALLKPAITDLIKTGNFEVDDIVLKISTQLKDNILNDPDIPQLYKTIVQNMSPEELTKIISPIIEELVNSITVILASEKVDSGNDAIVEAAVSDAIEMMVEEKKK